MIMIAIVCFNEAHMLAALEGSQAAAAAKGCADPPPVDIYIYIYIYIYDI